ncbi:MAG: alpha/beta hydrolase [Cereibacter sphaeroides]|uniref:Monoacylglycerol lipase n=1 Tax=Cereibacter sphaeroides TaxID=1063 RepID=A0A2W5S9S2_CERSP|nr:MAG: alpha/beta hydrolase [Cereibacter sphaeroides]
MTEKFTAHVETFRSRDGLSIYLRSWVPDGHARAILLIVHGFNSHSGQYVPVGEYFAATGLAAYALDLRGRGRSEGERFYVEDFADYLADVRHMAEIARSRHPGLQIFLLGHSAGGVVSSVFALEHQDKLAGLICESFAFQVPAPDVALLALKGLSHLLPHVHVLKLKIEDFSRDPVVMERLLADPLIQDEVQPTKTVAEMVRADERLKREFPKITLPVLILHGTEDRVTRPSGSQEFFDNAGSSDKTLKLYEGHWHDLLADIGRESVLADILGWIDARVRAS